MGIWLHLSGNKKKMKRCPRLSWRRRSLLRWVTLVGLTLGCGGKRLVSSIKRGEKLDLRSADRCGRPSWHVSGTGCMPGVGGSCWLGGLGGPLPVAALLGTWSQRQRSREVKTLEGGAREQVGRREVAEGLRGGVVSSCALTQLCPNSWKSNPLPSHLGL